MYISTSKPEEFIMRAASFVLTAFVGLRGLRRTVPLTRVPTYRCSTGIVHLAEQRAYSISVCMFYETPINGKPEQYMQSLLGGVTGISPG